MQRIGCVLNPKILQVIPFKSSLKTKKGHSTVFTNYFLNCRHRYLPLIVGYAQEKTVIPKEAIDGGHRRTHRGPQHQQEEHTLPHLGTL